MDTDGVKNGRSFDDNTWMRMDVTRPHSGRRSARVFLPSGRATLVPLPCEKGGEPAQVCRPGPFFFLFVCGAAKFVAHATAAGASTLVGAS